MRIEELAPQALEAELRGSGCTYKVGPFVMRVRTNAPPVVQFFRGLYANHAHAPGEFAEATVDVRLQRYARKPWQSIARLWLDDTSPLNPAPSHHAPVLMEFGLNWVIGARAHSHLLLHSAVLERRGRVVVLPATSGSGKSTLCMALLSRGWRLFSDEFCVIRPEDDRAMPMPRGVSLKNQSIELARRFHPHAYFTPILHGTGKGEMAFMRAPRDALERVTETARIGAFVFPRWEAGAALQASELSQGQSFARVVENSMNYRALGERGFHCLARIIEAAPSKTLVYSDTEVRWRGSKISTAAWSDVPMRLIDPTAQALLLAL